MGNRAVITNYIKGETLEEFKEGSNPRIGIYVHWNGGVKSIVSFLMYCKMKGYRETNYDDYGWARLCQVIANFFGGTTSVGINLVENLDCDNWDNGVYLIEDWEIKGRYYTTSEDSEVNDYEIIEMLKEIDSSMPESEQIGVENIEDLFYKYNTLQF